MHVSSYYCYTEMQKLSLAAELQNSVVRAFFIYGPLFDVMKKRKCATVRLLINLA